jgi:predicted small secreted protein
MANENTVGDTTPARNRTLSLVGLAGMMAVGLLLSGCNTTAGAGKDVSATGAAISHGATAVKNGL